MPDRDDWHTILDIDSDSDTPDDCDCPTWLAWVGGIAGALVVVAWTYALIRLAVWWGT